MISKKGFDLPYVTETFFINEEQKAFLFLLRVFGLQQKISQRWIDKKRLYCDGLVVERKSQIISGKIDVIYFKAETQNLKPIFETSDFLVYDKPSKVLVHPRNRTTRYCLLDELKSHYGEEANIIHRIDYETSGLVLCAKSKKVEIELKSLFEEKKVQKIYLALVKGKISSDIFIDEPLGRDENSIIKVKMFVKKDGKKSSTKIVPLEYNFFNDTTLVEAHPYTGRQHQIRTHLFHVKHPIVGDPIYGQDEKDTDRFLNKLMSDEEREKLTGNSRLMLHAQSLDFIYNNRYLITSQSKLPI